MKKFLLLTLLIAICFIFSACKAEVNVYLDSSEESVGSDISSGDAADESSQTDTGSSDASDTASTGDDTQEESTTKDEDDKKQDDKKQDDKNPDDNGQTEGTQQPSTPQVTEYTVTFNSDGGSAVAAVKTSGKVTKPADPTREGHRFLGWYKQGSSTDWNFDDKVTENITLVARWQAIVEYNVTFETGEGSAVPPSKTSGGKVIRPADPTYQKYKFSGWVEKFSGETWDFDKTVNSDITLVAVWELTGDLAPDGWFPL